MLFRTLLLFNTLMSCKAKTKMLLQPRLPLLRGIDANPAPPDFCFLEIMSDTLSLTSALTSVFSKAFAQGFLFHGLTAETP